MATFNFRLPDDLYHQAKAAAMADDRSLNSWLVSVVRRAVEPDQTPHRRQRRGPAPRDARQSES